MTNYNDIQNRADAIVTEHLNDFQKFADEKLFTFVEDFAIDFIGSPEGDSDEEYNEQMLLVMAVCSQIARLAFPNRP